MRLATFDLNLLKVLNALFEERSVTRTGERLGLTQSAISNSLRRLRQALDDPLFVRSSDGLVATPRAREIEDQVRAILRLSELCLADSTAFDPLTASGLFRIGAPDRLSLPVMLPLLKAVRSRAPGIDVSFRITDREQALALLDDDQLDLAIGWFDRPPGRLHASFLFREALVCLCGRAHPIRGDGHSVDLPTVLSYPHLVVSSAGDRAAAFDVILARRGLRRHAAVSVSNFAMVPDLLHHSPLIGVFTERVAGLLAERFDLVMHPLPQDLSALDHYMVWHRRYEEDRRHVWLRDQVTRLCDPD